MEEVKDVTAAAVEDEKEQRVKAEAETVDRIDASGSREEVKEKIPALAPPPQPSLKTDLNEIEEVEEDEGEGGEEQDVVVLADKIETSAAGNKTKTKSKSKRKSSSTPEKSESEEEAAMVMAAAPPTAAKDELLLTLGRSWGAPLPGKKPVAEEVAIKHKQQRGGGAKPASSSLGGGEISLSLGSSGKLGGAAAPSLSNTTTVSPSNNTRSFVHNPSCSLTHNSLDDLHSSAATLSGAAAGENETVSHGGLFGPHGLIQRSARIAAAAAAAPPKTSVSGGGGGGAPTKWNSYNLEQYHALFPDLKEGFRARYAGARRGKHQHGNKDDRENRVGLYEIASDPIATVAHRLQELPDIFLDDLRHSLTEMLGSVDKRDEFVRLQRILQRRSDLSPETLYVAHRTQLELLVAIKTGIRAFVQRDTPLSTAALVEIFFHKRCRNLACQSQLPADDCDCHFCSLKEGFCSACMCLACSKFDFMANTCRWVGCNFCLHWCHTDCGIRLSYIRPGAGNAAVGGGAGVGQSEMQFVCVACGLASDLFGFVREVFTTYCKDWTPEVLRQELDCIQRIFRRSQDFRGKQLCWIAEKMLSKVESCSDTAGVCETLVQFFQDGKIDVEKAKAQQPPMQQQHQHQQLQQQQQTQSGGGGELVTRGNSYGNPSEEMVVKSGGAISSSNLQILDRELEAKRNEIAEMQYSRARKRSEIEEMESAIHIKQAEAKMFQLRADEARLEAERLRKIVLAKSEKIEEDFVSKGYKLHVSNAMEKRKRCFVEYQELEKGLHEFNSMKAKLVTDVHDVLRKMDVMKRNKML